MDFERKYAPTTLDDFVWPNSDVEDFFRQYVAATSHQPLIVHGPFGTGKSTIVNMLRELIYPGAQDFGLLTYQAAEFESRHKTKDEIDTHSRLAQSDGGRPMVIIHDVENCPPALKNMFRGILDELAGRALFLFTTNRLDKLDPALRSRCSQVEMPAPQPQPWVNRLTEILTAENLPVPSQEHLLQLIHAGEGDVRKILQIAGQYANVVIARRRELAAQKASQQTHPSGAASPASCGP